MHRNAPPRTHRNAHAHADARTQTPSRFTDVVRVVPKVTPYEIKRIVDSSKVVYVSGGNNFSNLFCSSKILINDPNKY